MTRVTEEVWVECQVCEKGFDNYPEGMKVVTYLCGRHLKMLLRRSPKTPTRPITPTERKYLLVCQSTTLCLNSPTQAAYITIHEGEKNDA